MNTAQQIKEMSNQPQEWVLFPVDGAFTGVGAAHTTSQAYGDDVKTCSIVLLSIDACEYQPREHKSFFEFEFFNFATMDCFDLLESQVNRSVLEEYDEDDARTNGVRTRAAAAARLKAKIPFEERIDIVPNNRSLFVVN